MYGQGNNFQFHHAPQNQLPPPPFQPTPTGPSPPGTAHSAIHHGPSFHTRSLQTPPCPHPLPYQLGPLNPPTSLSGNLYSSASADTGKSYGHPLPPPYALPRPLFPPPFLSHGAVHVSPPIPSPSRVYPPPPLQGQSLYKTPAPPPPGIHHLPIPPPQPYSFVSISPVPFLSSGSMLVKDEQPTSLSPPPPPPPPPQPPSSPPPIPPSPTLLVYPLMDKLDASNASTVSIVHRRVTLDHVATPVHLIGHSSLVVPVGEAEAVNAEKHNSEPKVSFQDLPSPPPKPVDEKIVHNIKVLCQYTLRIGPDFENMVHQKETGNPQFAFLYGGEPGSDAAVAHEYFQWMKKKNHLQGEMSKEPGQNSASITPSNDKAINSPASSDMDMEDDLPDSDCGGHEKCNKELVGDISTADEGHFGAPSHVLRNGEEHLTSASPQHDTEYFSDQLVHLENKVDKNSSFIQDVNPVSPSLSDFKFAEEAELLKNSVQFHKDVYRVNEPSVSSRNKTEKSSRIFVTDESPFQLIQGYASDNSEEGDKGSHVDISPTRPSESLATNLLKVHIDNRLGLSSSSTSKNDQTANIERCNQADSVQTSYNIPKESSSSPSIISHCSDKENLDDEARNFEHSKGYIVLEADGLEIKQVVKNQPKGAKFDGSKPNQDGLVHEGLSDSDSDGRRHNVRCGKQGRCSRCSGSPPRHRWRSRSPRQRCNHNRSCSHSPRDKSPQAVRRSKFALRRQDMNRHHESLNFVKVQGFHGASSHFLHPDIPHSWVLQKVCQDPSQEYCNYDEHGHAPSDTSHFVTKMGRKVFHKPDQDEPVETCSVLVESNNTSKDKVGQKSAQGSLIDHALSRIRDDDMKLKDINQHQCLHNINNQLLGTQQSQAGKEHVESDQSKAAKSIMIQSSPAGAQEFNKIVLEQPNRGLLSKSPVDQLFVNNAGGTSQISNECLPQKELEVSNFPIPNNESQLQSLVANNASVPLASPHPTNSISPASVCPTFLSQTNLLHHNQQQIAYEYNSKNAHTSNDMQLNLSVPTMPHANIFPARPSISLIKYPLLQQQNVVPPKNDFVQPSSELLLHGEFNDSKSEAFNPHPLYPTESSQHPPADIAEYKQNLPMGIQQDRPFHGEGHVLGHEGPVLLDSHHLEYRMHHRLFVNEDVRIPLPGQESNASSHGNIMHLQSFPLAREPFPKEPFLSGDHLQPRFHTRQEFSSMKDLPYSNYQTSFAHQHHTSSFPSTLGGHSMINPSIQKIPLEADPLTQISGITIPKTSISMHYNPFASTFEQVPATSKSTSGAHVLGKGTDYTINYGSSFCSGYGSVRGLSSQMTSSPLSFRGLDEQFVPKIAGYVLETSGVSSELQTKLVKAPIGDNLYDPLFDSIEPSSDKSEKLAHVQKQGQLISDADPVSKFSSLSRSVEIALNNEGKRIVFSELKSEDDFGEETTDAEVGVVEDNSPQLLDGKDWKPDTPIELANTGNGEIEINQVHSPGKKKKTKESRSLKIFRIALADFVKEVLKPSWRQGNMSKEAFKTIVKKTVDKVSGSVPIRKIPKTQAKIDKYVESSQRKLTKLVMGYVDKYVKM